MTTTAARLNYLDPSVECSLYRNGRLWTRRDAAGSDDEYRGVVLTRHEVELHDGRGCEEDERPTLVEQGFELLDAPLGGTMDFLDATAVAASYYDECERILQEATGAASVFAFDHNVRSAPDKSGRRRIRGGQEVQAPARVVHGDYTLTSAPERLRALARKPAANDTYVGRLGGRPSLLDSGRVEQAIDSGRFALINVWRNIDQTPVESDPLALCDARSVAPGDLVVFEIHYSDRIGENYFARPADAHRWYGFAGVTRDEALLILQWDSSGTLARTEGAEPDAAFPDRPCSFSFHTAYFDPATMADAAPRRSIEVRCALLFD